MSKHIEFYTKTQSWFSEFSNYSPLHNGTLPNRSIDTASVRIDGEVITFEDEVIPELLFRTLFLMNEKHINAGINCRRFTALLFNPAIAESLPTSFMQPDYLSPVDVLDRTVTSPVALGTLGDASSLSDSDFYNRHMAYPAHYAGEPYYLHKLGYAGPVCLSQLQPAMDMYDCTDAFIPYGIATGQLHRQA